MHFGKNDKSEFAVEIKPDFYIAKRNELGYDLMDEDIPYEHLGEVWYVGVDSSGRNASNDQLETFTLSNYRGWSLCNTMFGDCIFYDSPWPKQLNALDITMLKSPTDGQLKVTIIGENQYKTELIK